MRRSELKSDTNHPMERPILEKGEKLGKCENLGKLVPVSGPLFQDNCAVQLAPRGSTSKKSGSVCACAPPASHCANLRTVQQINSCANCFCPRIDPGTGFFVSSRNKVKLDVHNLVIIVVYLPVDLEINRLGQMKYATTKDDTK